jgi:hypothetical protein
VHGTPEECRRRIEEYATAGITTTAPAIFAAGDELKAMLRALAPNA